MRTYRLWQTAWIAAVCAFPASDVAAQRPPVPAVLLTRPVDVSSAKSEKDRWFSALSEAVLRFKMDALPGIRVAPLSVVIKNLPAITNFGSEIPDRDYATLAQKLRATHLVTVKYELADGGKTVQYYAEITAAAGGAIVGSVDRSFPVEATGENLDSSIVQMLKTLGVATPPILQRFFTYTVLSSDPRSLRELGEALLLSYSPSADMSVQQAEALTTLVARDSRMELAYFLCGKAYVQAGRYKKAADMFKSFFDVLPEYPPLYFDYVRSLRLAKDYGEALRIVTIGEGKLPGYIPLAIEKAEVLDDAGQKGAAEKAFAQVLALDPEQSDALVFLARVTNERGKPLEAIGFADRILKKNPADCRALVEKGKALQTVGKHDEAIAVFKQAADCDQRDPSSVVNLGDAFLADKAYDKAAERYEQGARLLPNEFGIHEKAARAYRLAGNPAKALAILKSVEGRFSTNTILQKELGLLELTSGDTSSSRKHLESCFGEQKGDARVLMGLGDLYTGLVRFDEAYKMYNTAMTVIDDKNACRIALARLYLLKNAASQALAYLTEVMNSDPKYRNVNRLYGDARLMSADKKGALPFYLRERELYGDNVYLQDRIVFLSFDAATWPQVESEGVRLLKLDPGNAAGTYRLAVACLQLKNKERARTYLAAAEKLGKADQEILFQMARGYSVNGMFDKSAEAYYACLALSPKREAAWLELADALIALRRDREAADAYVQLFGINGDKYQAKLADAGHVFFRLGLKPEAKRAYTLFLDKKYVDPNVNARLAAIEYEAKNYSTVIALLENIGGEWATNEPAQMSLAESYYASGVYAKALPVLARVLSANGNQKRAVELSAFSDEKSGNLLDASLMYERYLAFPASDKHVDYAFHLGDLYEKQRMKDKAIGRYARNLDLFSSDLRNYRRLAEIYFEAERWRDCEQVLLRADKIPDAPAVFQLMLARSLARQNRADDAILRYQQYLTRAPADSAAWNELGSLFFVRKDYVKAISPLAMAVKYMPANIECMRKLGVAYYETNRFDEAVGQLDNVARARKSDTEVIGLLARCHRSRKDTSDLIGTLRQWLAVDAKNYDVALELGGLLVAKKTMDEATVVLKSAVKLSDTDPRPYRFLARAFEAQNNDKERLGALRAVADRAPRDPEAPYQLARYYLAKSQDAEAEPFLKSAIELGAAHVAARYEYARLMLRANKPVPAYALLTEAAALEPDNALIRCGLALAASLIDKVDESVSAADAALEKEPVPIEILYTAALVYTRGGQTVKAKQLLRSALTLNDTCRECHEALGDANMVEANYKLAVKSLMRAWELGGFRESVVFKLGRALSLDNKYVEAKDFLKLVLSKNPANDRAVFELSRILCREDNPQEAQKVVDAFTKKYDKTGWIHLALGEIHEAEGATDAAWISFNVALRLLPDEPLVQGACGRIYLARGQYQDAAEQFGRAMAKDPNNPDLLVNLAEATDGLNDPASALELCKSAVQRVPENPYPFYVMARIHSKAKDHRAALDVIVAGLKGSPTSAKLLYIQGHELRATGQPAAAVTSYEAALKYGAKTNLEAYRHIGDVYFEDLKNSATAREYYQKYVKAGGTNVETLERLKSLGG